MNYIGLARFKGYIYLKFLTNCESESAARDEFKGAFEKKSGYTKIDWYWGDAGEEEPEMNYVVGELITEETFNNNLHKGWELN